MTDSFVSGTDPESAVSRSAYLLFYRRRSDKPLGSVRLQELVNKAAEASPASSSDREPAPSDSSTEETSTSTSTSESIPGTSVLKDSGPGITINGGAVLQQSAPIDEGLGDMEDDPDNPLPGVEEQPTTRFYSEPNWSFNRIQADAPANSDISLGESEALDGGDNTSNRPDPGSDPGDRMKDFDEDFPQAGQMAHLPPGTDEEAALEHVPMEGLQRGHSVEEEVAEIRVTDDDEKMTV